MKDLRYLFVLLLLGITTNAFAQLRLGAGIGYGADIEELGLQLRVLAPFSSEWRGDANFIYYLEGNDNISFWELNFNGNYVFFNNGRNSVHALAGLNFFHIGREFRDDNTELGLNLGIGAIFGLNGPINLLTDLKFSTGDAGQLVLGLGILFLL